MSGSHVDVEVYLDPGDYRKWPKVLESIVSAWVISVSNGDMYVYCGTEKFAHEIGRTIAKKVPGDIEATYVVMEVAFGSSRKVRSEGKVEYVPNLER